MSVRAPVHVPSTSFFEDLKDTVTNKSSSRHEGKYSEDILLEQNPSHPHASSTAFDMQSKESR